MFPFALVLHLVAAGPGPAEAAPPLPAVELAAAFPVGAAPAGGAPQLALPSVGLPGPQPRLAGGPFGFAELAGASLGALAGDGLVLGIGYGALQLFAHDVITPTADNFRRTALLLAGTALVLPPLLAVVGARLLGGRGAGGFWKAMLLASAGQVAALLTGYWASPHLWAFVPAQLAALSAGASVGLHWGPSGRRPQAGLEASRMERAAPPLALALSGGCPVDG